MATTTTRVFLLIRVFVFVYVYVWPAAISAYVGLFADCLAKALRIASFTYPIVVGVLSLVATVVLPSLSYRLSNTLLYTARTS